MKLAAKLSQVMGKLGYVQKGGTNSAQGYKYVLASDVADKVRAALGELNVIMVPAAVDVISEGVTPKGTQTIVTARYTWRFIDGDSGETLDIQTLGSGADSGDKHVYKSSTADVVTFMLPRTCATQFSVKSCYPDASLFICLFRLHWNLLGSICPPA